MSELTEKILAYRDEHPEANYSAIAAAVACSKSSVFRALHPEREREHNLRRSAAKLAWADENDRKECKICGRPCAVGQHRKPGWNGLCWYCSKEVREAAKHARWQIIADLWRQGRTLKEIADLLDTTPGAISTAIAEIRAAGWSLPHRYRVGAGGRRLPNERTLEDSAPYRS